MLIDWFTVGAQVVNFIIMVWLMKRFLYKPILDAIESREKRIATELADADVKKAEAQKERDEFQQKNEEFDRQRATLLGKATDEAKAESQRLLEDAREKADALDIKYKETLRNEVQSLEEEIGRRTGQEVFAVARKALTDLATTSLEERISEVFILRLRGLEGKTKQVLAEALRSVSKPVIIRSSYALNGTQCAEIQKAVHETFSNDIPLRFETSPDQISGIELTANGQKVGWNIADYLTSMEEKVSALLKEHEKPIVKSEPKQVSKAMPKAEPKPEEKSAPKPELKSEDKGVPKLEPKPDEKVAPKPEPTADEKAVPQPEPKPEDKAAPKPEPVPEVKPESKPESKTEADGEAKPEAPVKIKPETKGA
jgi:F-type H+-transporting ATPase subunit b